VACNIQGYSSAKAAQALAERGIFVWHGNYYAIQLSRRLGQEPNGMIRIGLTHYNTSREVDDTIEAIASL
jgi:selenocysteine lyase/cysteine desulfurase